MRKTGRPQMSAEEKRVERVSMFFTRREMRALEQLAADLEQSLQVTLRRIVLLALKRHREDKANREAAQ